MKGTSTQPDLRIIQRSFQGYRSRLYDLFGDQSTRPFRLLAVKRLGDSRDATVVDLGCGTGLSLPYLVAAVGPGGRVIGVDASPDMLARRRIESAGWQNVELVEAFAHEWQPDGSVDAVFMCNVNQLLCSVEVMTNVVSLLKSGGRVVASGGKKGRGLSGLVRAAFVRVTVLFAQREHSAARWILQERPWQELEALLPGLQVEEALGGNAFVAWGVKP
jgi:ubiquinone/menaquinone biosynthesis C-methylase UbiE